MDPRLRPGRRDPIGGRDVHVAGSLLVIVATLLGVTSLLLLTGDLGWTGRVGGGAVLVAATGSFLLGRRLTDDYRVQRRR